MDRGVVVEAGEHEELLALEGLYRQLWEVQTGAQRGSRESAWSGPRRDVVTAGNALVDALRLLMAAGSADLAALAENAASDELREAASILAALTPEQLDALRDLDGVRLAELFGDAARPAAALEAAL
jgi:hypothetical protein